MKELKHRPWRVLESEYLAHEPWFTVRRERVELPSGAIVPTWYVLEYPDWVNVIAITREGEFVFVSQYRHALQCTSYELVAGVRDPEDATVEEAARRELLEETGYGNGQWQQYMTLSANPTSHNNLTYTFLAVGVEKLCEQHTEATEDIKVHLLSFDEVNELLQNNQIVQSLMAAPLWRYVHERYNKTYQNK